MKKALKIMALVPIIFPWITFISLGIIVGEGTSDDPVIITFAWVAFAMAPVQWLLFIPNVFRNTTVAKNQRAIWVFLLFGGHFVVSPFYWYFHIWKDVDNTKENKAESTTEMPLK